MTEMTLRAGLSPCARRKQNRQPASFPSFRHIAFRDIFGHLEMREKAMVEEMVSRMNSRKWVTCVHGMA
jgi:hypothetical protein